MKQKVKFKYRNRDSRNCFIPRKWNKWEMKVLHQQSNIRELTTKYHQFCGVYNAAKADQRNNLESAHVLPIACRASVDMVAETAWPISDQPLCCVPLLELKSRAFCNKLSPHDTSCVPATLGVALPMLGVIYTKELC